MAALLFTRILGDMMSVLLLLFLPFLRVYFSRAASRSDYCIFVLFTAYLNDKDSPGYDIRDTVCCMHTRINADDSKVQNFNLQSVNLCWIYPRP